MEAKRASSSSAYFTKDACVCSVEPRIVDDGKILAGFVYFGEKGGGNPGRVGFSLQTKDMEKPIWYANGWRNPDDWELVRVIEALARYHHRLDPRLQEQLLDAIPGYRQAIGE